MLKRSFVFVDASAWIALLDVSDGYHARASTFWRSALEDERQFLTSDYVLDETYTLLRRRRRGLRMAVGLHDLVVASEIIDEVEVDIRLRALGWELFVGYEDKVLSFTDCTSFALMRERKLLDAFTFDSDFERAGFVVLPG